MDIRKIRVQREKIEFIQERITRLRSAMEIGTRQMQDVPGGSNYAVDRLAKDMAKLDELERQLCDAAVELRMEENYIAYSFRDLPERQRCVMELRYVEGLSWRQVADKMGYSIRYCLWLNNKVMHTISKG